MSWIRNVAALAAVAALLLTPHLLPGSAATQARSAVAVAPSAAVAATPLIQGVVVDQFGTYVDDVTVQAIRANGTPVASTLTYASEWEDGPQHGYFFLEVGAVGTYTITVSKKGYETVELDSNEVDRPRQRLSLGEIEIEKRGASTTTSASLTKRTIKTREQAVVEVKVSTKATKKPVGVVEVREGDLVIGSDTLVAGDRGEVTIKVKKLGKGEHRLTVHFLGSKTLAASSTKNPLTLVVVKPRR